MEEQEDKPKIGEMMKKNRKLVGVLLVMALSVAASGCASNSSDSENASNGAEAGEGNSLTDAWAGDWAIAGLENPGIAVSDWAISNVDTSGFKKDGPYRIGFASQGPTNSWATVYDEALKARAAELNVELVYVSADGKEDKQVNDLNDLLAQGVDAVVVAPMGPAIAAPVKRLTDAKVPVIACAGELPEATATVVRDNRLNGAMYAEWIAKKIKGKGNIIMLSGILATQTALNRKDAALEVFAKYPDIKILDSGETNWSPTEAKTVMEQLLTKHGDKIDAIWSDSGINDVGVIPVYVEAGKKIPPMTGEPLNGFLKLAKTHNVDFLAVGYPPTMSVDCLNAAVDALQGKPLTSWVNAPVPIFELSGVDKFVKEACSDDLWVPAVGLGDELLKKLKLC